MSAKIETGDVDGARTVFDDKKNSLKTIWDSIKDARGFQVSEETKKKMETDATKNMTTLTNASMKGASEFDGDQKKAEDLKKLVQDYTDIFKM